jgi:hypothetical protein
MLKCVQRKSDCFSRQGGIAMTMKELRRFTNATINVQLH